GGSAPAASAPGSPAPSGGAGGGGAGASPGSGGAAADVTITAANIAFVGTSLDAPTGRAFTIHFQNNDAGIPHNVDIHKDSPTGASVWKGEIFPGVDSRLYQVPPLEPGTYAFACDVHPAMT